MRELDAKSSRSGLIWGENFKPAPHRGADDWGGGVKSSKSVFCGENPLIWGRGSSLADSSQIAHRRRGLNNISYSKASWKHHDDWNFLCASPTTHMLNHIRCRFTDHGRLRLKARTLQGPRLLLGPWRKAAAVLHKPSQVWGILLLPTKRKIFKDLKCSIFQNWPWMME